MSLPFRDLAYYGDWKRQLGKGSYAEVYITDKDFAIKSSHNDDHLIPEGAAIKEVVSLLKVTSPYVIPVIDVVLKDSSTKIVLPVANSDLWSAMQKPGLDVDKIALQIALGLADIHNSNLLHLDLKPDNILLHGPVDDPDIWIADLGLSEVHACALPPLEGIYFTVPYRAPELTVFMAPTDKSDVWAYGIMLMELFIYEATGERKRFFGADSNMDLIYKIIRYVGQADAYPENEEWIKRNLPRLLSQQTFASYLRDKGLPEARIELLEKILIVDYKKRPSIFQVIEYLTEVSPIELTCREKLEKYSHAPAFNWSSYKSRTNVIKGLFELANELFLEHKTVSTAVYLLDRYVEIRPERSEDDLDMYIRAALYLGDVVYSQHGISPEDLIERESRDSFVKAMRDLLTLTSFDLAAATSYIFLSNYLKSHPEKEGIIVEFWVKSVVTPFHFRPPREVADAIINLAQVVH